MATEEQTSYDESYSLYSGNVVRRGQRLTISDREVTKLSFPLHKDGSPTGNVTFTIRKVSDDSIIASKVWGDASGLEASATWEEVTLTTPVTVNEEVRILVEFAGGDSSNCVHYHQYFANPKSDERSTYFITAYSDHLFGYDGAYIYTYNVEDNQLVTPPTIELVLTPYVPDILIPGNEYITPTTLGLHILRSLPLVQLSEETATDVGSAAIDRALLELGGWTYILRNNPINATGTITSVEIRAQKSLTNCKVGIFYPVGEPYWYIVYWRQMWKCRSAVTIGDVPSGSKQTFSDLSLTAEIGDCIGVFYSGGGIEWDTTGHGGQWEVTGYHCDVDDETAYQLQWVEATQSLYATGIIRTIVTPPTSALTLTTYAPTITVEYKITPSTLALTLTTYAPNVIIVATVGTTTGGSSIRLPTQRNAFYAAGRYWVFYNLLDTNRLVYRTSTDGSSWSDVTEVASLPTQYGANFDIVFDGTYVHYIRNTGIDSGRFTGLTYRRGIPQSNGTISWSAVEQTVQDDTHIFDDASIAVDSNRYPWVAYAGGETGVNFGNGMVITSSTNDGTWATSSGYPLSLYDEADKANLAFAVPQTDGKLVAFFYRIAPVSGVGMIKARFYNGSSWAAIETVTANLLDDGAFGMLCATSIDDEIHLVYRKYYTDQLRYIHGHQGSWTDDTLVSSANMASTSTPVISRNGEEVYVFWLGSDNHAYYRKRNADGSWNSVVDWISEVADGFTNAMCIQSYFQGFDDRIGLCYQTKASSPYNVRFAYLLGGVVTPPTLSLTITTYALVVLTPRVATPPTLALTLTTYTPTITVAGVEYTEEQTKHSSCIIPIYDSWYERVGQQKTISNRTVSKLAFWVNVAGSPTGDVTFAVRDLAGNLLVSKLFGDASTIVHASWNEVTFDTPTLINGEIKMYLEFSGGNSSNHLRVCNSGTNIKDNEHIEAWWQPTTTWINMGTADCAYKYTYILPPNVVIPPTVALTLTTYAPVVTATTSMVIVSTLELAPTTYAPTILAPRVLTPATILLALTIYEPCILTSVTATPTTLVLTVTKYVPDIIVGVTVVPSTLQLDITVYDAVVTSTNDKVVIPDTLALILTTYELGILIPGWVTPPTLALTLTSYIPSIIVPGVVTPSTLDLTLTTYTPSVIGGITLTPATLALDITTYEPIVPTPMVAMPSTLSLILTAYIASVLSPQVLTPDTIALILTLYNPNAFITILDVTVTPATLALILTLYAPDVGFPTPLARMLILIMNEVRMRAEAIDKSKITIELKGGG